jgi:hypothetical protein
MTQTLDQQTPVTADSLYIGIQHFYARQMQLLDAGRTAEWAATFTEDGVFAAGGVSEPVRTRAKISAGAEQVARQYAAAGIVRRHWLGMLSVELHDDEVHTRTYALVLEINPGGDVVARRSTLCDDRLERAGDTWFVKYRKVTRDGLD